MPQKLIDLLPNKEEDWFKELIKSFNDTLKLFSNLTEEQAYFKYAENKWTLKQLLDHLTECEKIFNYRALRFTKNDGIALASFDENLYVDNSTANAQPLTILIEEFKLTRLSTIYFYGKLSHKDLQKTGIANNQKYSVEYIVKHITQHNYHH